MLVFHTDTWAAFTWTLYMCCVMNIQQLNEAMLLYSTAFAACTVKWGEVINEPLLCMACLLETLQNCPSACSPGESIVNFITYLMNDVSALNCCKLSSGHSCRWTYICHILYICLVEYCISCQHFCLSTVALWIIDAHHVFLVERKSVHMITSN